MRFDVTRWRNTLAGLWKRPDLLVIFGYLALTVFMTYPLAFRLEVEATGKGNDMWVSHWNNWWIQKALLEGQNPYRTTYLFYPQGTSLLWHSFSWLNTGIWMLLQPITGALAAHGITVLLTYVLGGYTTYLLALEVTGSRRAAFLAGLVFIFFPQRNAHRNQLKMLSSQWIPLFMLYFMRATRGGRWRDGIKAGLAMALCGLSSVQLMILSGFWAGGWLLYSLCAEREMWSRRTIWALLVAGVICGVIVTPFFAPLVAAWIDPSASQDLAPDSTQEVSADLLAFFSPSRYHPLFRDGGALEAVYGRWIHVEGAVVAIGYGTLALAICAAFKRWQKARFWTLSALVCLVIALGSTLRINGRSFPGLPMPYRLLAPTFVGASLRNPERFGVLLGVAVAVLAALGATRLMEVVNRRGWQNLAFVCVGALVLFEYLFIPYPTTQPIRSAFYDQLAQEAGQFAVADFPIGFHAHDKWYMYAQTLHGRPMVGGHVSRVPAHAHDFIDSVPLLAAAKVSSPERGMLDDVSRQLEPLSRAGVRYVLIHKYRISSEEVENWRAWFGVRAHYEDEYLLVFNTTPQYGRDFEFVGELGDGIGVIEATLSTHTIEQGSALEADVTWGSTQAPQKEWKAYIALLGPDGREVRREVFDPCADWSTSEWGQNAIARTHITLPGDPFLEGGAYMVVLGLFDPEMGQAAGEPFEIGQVTVEAISRSFERPEVAFVCEATFDAELGLLGYDLEQSDEWLVVTLHWQALRRMDVAYKFFVYLVDSETGELAAQVDVMPYSWTYPTFWWEEGEFVSDEIRLPLTDVPPGVYWLEVGVYDPDSGIRLLLEEAPEQGLPADRLVLTKEVRVR